MSTDREARRKQVAKLLAEGLDAKLQRASWDRALEKLEQARAMATESPQVVAPWPALTAYRLAHVRMRKGDLTLEELEAIEKLFVAARNPCLGVLPFVYQVAALRRMKGRNEADDSDLDDRINEVMKAAFKALNQYAAHHQDVEQALNLGAYEEDDDDNDEVSREYTPVTESMLQYNAFNLLELAAYFVGHDSREWDGYGNLPQSDHLEVETSKASWRVVGTGIAPVKCSEAITKAELEARSKEHPDALTLWLPEAGEKARYIRNGVARKLNDRLAALLLFPYVTLGQIPTKKRLVETIFARSLDDWAVEVSLDKADQNYRQAVSREARGLARKLGRSQDDLLVEIGTGAHRLNPELRMYAAVHRNSILG